MRFMKTKTFFRFGVPLVTIAVVAALATPSVLAQNAPSWVNQDGNWAANKEKLQAFGERFAALAQGGPQDAAGRRLGL